MARCVRPAPFARSMRFTTLPCGTPLSALRMTCVPLSRWNEAANTASTSASFGGKPMKDADVDAVFAASFQRDKGTQVILKADKGVPHGKVVNLMERAKGAGLTHLAIGTSGG